MTSNEFYAAWPQSFCASTAALVRRRCMILQEMLRSAGPPSILLHTSLPEHFICNLITLRVTTAALCLTFQNRS